MISFTEIQVNQMLQTVYLDLLGSQRKRFRRRHSKKIWVCQSRRPNQIAIFAVQVHCWCKLYVHVGNDLCSCSKTVPLCNIFCFGLYFAENDLLTYSDPQNI